MTLFCSAGPNASVHAYAAAQVKAAMDATKRLGGENYVFWGGREGYHTLLNTDLKCAAPSPWPILQHDPCKPSLIYLLPQACFGEWECLHLTCSYWSACLHLCWSISC